MNRRADLQLLVIRYLGQLPKGASESVRLNWSRRLILRMGLPSLPVLIVGVILIDTTWLYVLSGVLVAMWIASLALVTRDIRRARSAEHAD
jgi:hypothetical protein